MRLKGSCRVIYMDRAIPFSGVGFSYQEDDINVVVESMKNLDTYTQGSKQKEFESNFSNLFGYKHSFAVSSAAAAIEIAAVLFGIKPGDEVIAPAHTYCASVYPFAKRGAKILWADINQDEFLLDINSVKSLISAKTKVIIAVHLYGSPVDMIELRAIASKYDVYILEDCAQSIGAKLNNQAVGTFGDIAVHSFHSHKNISTLGEGGMLSLNSGRWADQIPGLRHNGHRPFLVDKDMYWSPAMSDVDFDIEGEWPFNYCIGEVQCALGNHLLSKVEKINLKRRKRYQLAFNHLSRNRHIKLQMIPENKLSSHHLLPIQIVGLEYKKSADEVFRRLSETHKIFPAKQYYPLYRYGLFSKSGNGAASTPNTDTFYDNQVSLPFHYWMVDADFERMIQVTDFVVNEIAESIKF